MIKVGIDTLAIYTSRYSLSLQHLAAERGIDPNKFTVGLGQYEMSCPPPGEDIITLAATASLEALRDVDRSKIEMVLFATESGIDYSKSAGIYVHSLLNLPSHCRVVELKQACYSATAALQLALPFIRENPDKKVLVIASDIARYGLNTTGESSQGCGAAAMVLSANPRLIAFDREYGVVTDNVMDFWRPTYLHQALVEGKYSSKLYLMMLEASFKHYQAESGRTLADIDYFCYHTPVPRLVEKAHQHLLKINQVTQTDAEMNALLTPALAYNRLMGNSYTAALYVSLASLLDQHADDFTNKRIGFYSYGSGCVAEYFSGVVQPGYQNVLKKSYHTRMLATRQALSYQAYEDFYQFEYPEDGSLLELPHYAVGDFRLTRLHQHKRVYEKVGHDALAAHEPVHAELTL